MEDADIIIVGAGAAGLIAGRELTKAGLSVILLEARNRPGGRIHTLETTTHHTHIELGAEFVHGDLPITLGLLQEANIKYYKVRGRMWQVNNTSEQLYTGQQWELFEDKLRELENDITLADFLEKHFSGDAYAALRASVIGFASGYDTADPAKASTIALKKEWLEEEHSDQYRIENGYEQLINYLANECKKGRCEILLSSIVQQIHWAENSVEAITNAGKTYRAKKIIITVPMGILQLSESALGGISFHPGIPEKTDAFKMIGYGAIIKILLQFENNFWKDMSVRDYPGDTLEDWGFALSSAPIPTWWTQYPKDTGLLTGWLGGLKAEQLKDASEATILEMAMSSLSEILKIEKAILQEKLLTSYVMNWTTDPFSRGSYAYATIETETGRSILNTPVADTIYFCGEALSEKSEMGTVEAALDSGIYAARKILSGL